MSQCFWDKVLFVRLDKLQLLVSHTCSMFTEDKDMRSVHIVKHGDGSVCVGDNEIKRSWRCFEARHTACVIVRHLWLRGRGSSNRIMKFWNLQQSKENIGLFWSGLMFVLIWIVKLTHWELEQCNQETTATKIKLQSELSKLPQKIKSNQFIQKEMHCANR